MTRDGLAQVLQRHAAADTYAYYLVLVEGDYGFQRWPTTGDGINIHDGADSFVMRDGLIVMQTIAFAVRLDA